MTKKKKKEPIPRVWTDEKKATAIEDVLSKLGNGQSLRSVLDQTRDKDLLPCRTIFNEWLGNSEILATQYARACEARQDLIFEECLTIADDDSGDATVNEKGQISLDAEFVARSRVRIGTRQWMLGKMNPKKYGERIQQDVTIHEDQPLYPDKADDE
jgi:hypothetical protein